jgi:phenylacetic acid degradation operon negative regulatory protein
MTSIRPHDLVFTLFGEYLLQRPGRVPVGSLIDLLSPFGLSEGAVRTVLSRMVRRRWLVSGRGKGRGRYALSARGRHLLQAGEKRIFHPPWDEPWDGQWYLLAYSIPESRRRLRNRLRVRLAWLGFGSLGNGLWLSPHDVDREVRELARSFRLESRLVSFRGPVAGPTDPAQLVRACWDVPGIDRRYAAFIGRWEREYERCRAAVPAGTLDAEACFVLRFRLIHEYREFLLIDPFLPRALLPPDWSGGDAAQLFRDLHDLLVAPADLHVDSVLKRSRERGRSSPRGPGTSNTYPRNDP